MKLWHATDRKNLASILEHGLLVSKADPTAKIKGCWLASSSNRPWGILHTQRKHHAQLEDIVIIEVKISRSRLTRFRPGLWYAVTDIEPGRLGQVIEGTTFGASASQ